MGTIKRHIPNFVTCLGLLSGCFSILYSNSGDLYLAGIFILVAAFFDFADGMLARLLHAINPVGKQLDSLADVISFGIAPSFIMYKLMLFSLVNSSPSSTFNIAEPGLAQTLLLGTSFLIAVFAALRLARFNTDETQTESFRGLATPAAALLIAAFAFVVTEDKHNLPFEQLLLKIWFLLISIAIICYLMVSPIRMFSLKFKHYGIQDNLLPYLFLLLSLVLLIAFGLPGIAPIIVLYILLSVVNSVYSKTKQS